MLAEINVRKDSESTQTTLRLVGGSAATPVEHLEEFVAGEGYEIPEDAVWLYRDPEALASVRRGLHQSAAGLGRVVSFAQYADED